MSPNLRNSGPLASGRSSTREKDDVFNEDFLRKLEYLKFVSNHLIPGHLKGQHRAKKRGSGLDFADYRPYVAGDDTRNVDWRTYLRLDKLLLRLFEEEADLPIYIFFDSSRSMDYGDPSKFDYARKVAAALCYIGLLNLDRVSLIAFADGVSEEMASRRGKNQIHQALRFLLGVEPNGPTGMQKAFKSFFAAKRRRGLVAVISDFLDREGVDGAFNVLRYLRHDVFNIHITTLEETRPELPDDVVLVDSEDGTDQPVRVTRGLLTAYQETFRRHCLAIESYCSKYNWGYIRTLNERPFEDLILQVFRQDRFLR